MTRDVDPKPTTLKICHIESQDEDNFTKAKMRELVVQLMRIMSHHSKLRKVSYPHMDCSLRNHNNIGQPNMARGIQISDFPDAMEKQSYRKKKRFQTSSGTPDKKCARYIPS